MNGKILAPWLTSLALTVSSCGGRWTRPVTVAVATPEARGAGIVQTRIGNAAWASVGTMAEVRGSDFIWRLKHGGLQFCSGEPAGTCRTVPTAGIVPDELLVPLEAESRRQRRARRSSGSGNAAPATRAPSGVWIRQFEAGHRSRLAYCAARPALRCQLAELPRGFGVKELVAGFELDGSAPEVSIWFTVARWGSPLNDLFNSGARRLMRCTASISSPEPQCTTVAGL
jgi:hypothetical protein